MEPFINRKISFAPYKLEKMESRNRKSHNSCCFPNQENQEKNKMSNKYRNKIDRHQKKKNPSCKFQEMTKILLDFGVEYKHFKTAKICQQD